MNAPANKSSRSVLGTIAGVIVIVGVGLVLAVMLRGGPVDSGAMTHAAVGVPLMGLSYTPLVGAERKVSSFDLKGKVVLVNYWGTWCGPCRQEFPHMVELYERIGANPDFELVSVSVEYEPRNEMEALRNETAAYAQRMGAGFPVYADPDGSNRMMFMQLSGGVVSVVPQTILLDQQGVVRAVWTGYEPGYEEEMAAAIDRLLAGADLETAPAE